jgi:N-acyl-D-aspartate/D-glutamate deacylase
MQPGSPMLGATADLLATLDALRERGVDVSCDAIPYTIGSTTLKSLLPPWSLDGGDEALLRRLRDPEQRAKIQADTMTHGAESGGSRKRNLVQEGKWDRIWLGSASVNAHLAGKSFAEIGQIRGQDPHDAVLDILIEEEARPWMLAEDVSEEDFLNIARHDAGGVISDGFSLAPEGVLAEGKHHPRSYGAFPYFLRHFIRDQGAMTWEQAVHKLTGYAAARFRLADRGLLREGAWADLVVFDPDRVGEAADFDDPYRYPHGIEHVFINGVAAVTDGELTDSRAGRILRRAA